MDWDALLLLLVGIYASAQTGGLAYRFNSLKYLGYSLGALFFTIGQASLLLAAFLGNQTFFNTTLIIELTSITSIAFVLCGLAVFIRESKPVFVQFPLIYAVAPLLLVVSYWIVRDSFAIKEWLMNIYQGGTVVVALMMYASHAYRNSYYVYSLSSVVLFAVTYILYWFVPGIESNYSWIWQLLLGISLLLAVQGFEFAIKESKTTQSKPAATT